MNLKKLVGKTIAEIDERYIKFTDGTEICLEIDSEDNYYGQTSYFPLWEEVRKRRVKP